ncbi:hypothetical protein [Nitrospira sp. Nam80]
MIAHPQDTNAMHTAWHQTPAWLLFATGLMVMPSVAASSAPFVPGEIIIQFDPGSEGHRLAMQASRQSVPDLTDFAPIVTRLETMTGIPLTAKQLVSGQRLLLAIDTNRMADKALLDLNLAALTHLAIQRLSAVSEIVSAQPNYRASFRTPEP